LPGLAETLNAVPRAFKGKSAITGKIALDNRSVGIRQALVEVDGSTAQGAVVVVPGETPEILSNLTLSNVDFDRYFTTSRGESVADAPADPFSTLVAGIDPAMLAGFNGKFVIQSGAFRRWRLDGDTLKASVEVRDGALILQQAEIGGFNGVDFALVGAVGWLDGAPHGSLTADIETDELRRLLDVPTLGRLVQSGDGALLRILGEAAPVQLHVDLDSERAGDLDRVAATIEGNVGGAVAQLTATYKGEWENFEQGDIKLDGTVSGDGGDVIARLLGREVQAGAANAQSESTLTISLTGSLAKGLGAAVMVNSFDTQLDVSGLITQNAGAVSVESEVAMTSDDASELFQALGVAPDGEPVAPVAINLKGLMSGAGDEIVITGLGGQIAGTPVGLDGTIDVSGARPTLFGNMTVAKIDLPWIVSRLLSLRSDRAAAAAGDAAAGTAWSAAPFDFALLGTLDLNLALQAGEVTLLGGAAGSRMQTEITVTEGAVRVERFSSAFAGGELRADAHLTAANGQLSMKADFSLEDAGFASTLSSPTGQAPLSGSFAMSGQLTGVGRSPIGFMSSLSGTGTLSVDNGALYGINPALFSQALQQASSASELDGIIRDTLVNGEMTFAGLTSAFEVNNGVARFEKAEIDGPAAAGSVRAVLDLPTWQLDSKWTIALKTFPSAPPLTVLLAGPATAPVRSYDTTALRSFFVVKGLTEGVRQLEELQREEQERIKRLEEMEKEAALRRGQREAERREAERLEAERLRKAQEAARAAREAEARRAAEEERLARQNAAITPDASLGTADPQGPAQTGAVNQPGADNPLSAEPRSKPKKSKTTSRIDPDDANADQLPPAEQLPLPEQLPAPELLQPLPSFGQRDADDVDVLALDPLDPQAEDQGEDGPVDITPDGRSPGTQESLFSDDPASWRK
jgi:uncharacterized protein involved in outer membrane biogenesis